MKTKSKFTNRNSTKNDKIKKFMCDTFGEDGKEQKMMTKKEKEMRDNLEEQKTKNILKKRITKKSKAQ